MTIRVPGRTSAIRRVSDAGSASPAKTSTSGRVVAEIWSSSSAKAEGTVDRICPSQPSRAASSRTSATISMLPPWQRLVKTSKTETSKLTEVLARALRPGPASIRPARCVMPLTTPRWVTATPFGTPEEPEVYIT
ncbi:hypothetical protein SGRIM128S_04581 [Streptomyces griseomycini]